MPQITRSAHVPYSAEQMFDLVNDIAAYPEYMPGCLKATVLSEQPETVEAELVLGKGGLEQSFTTCNTLKRPESMVMRLLKGPFKHFEGRWEFQAQESDSCNVTFTLDFSFSNPLMGMAAGSFLKDIASQQVEALQQRAKSVY